MTKKVIAAVAVIVVVVLGLLGYRVFRAPETASGPMTAIPIAQATTAPTVAATAAATVAPTTASAETTVAATTAPTAAATTGSSSPTILKVVAAESEARFVINEVLNGSPKTVVGTTKDVAGEIAIDTNDLSKTQVGTIQVNARSLTTDSNFRNRAIKNQILDTNNHEFITFAPTGISGLMQQGSVGQTYSFKIDGNLTIKGVTKPVTFDVTAQASSPTKISGKAQTTIKYADFGISIPSVPQVADVGETVQLELDLVASS